MEVKIKTIPHNEQRYSTVGDYQQQPDGSWYISVSETNNPKYNFLIALHEFIELYLTQFGGISEEEITNFDNYFEHRRELGFVKGNEEPGFDFASPYKRQHTIATGVEIMIAAELNIDWKEYENKLMEL